MNKVIGTMFVSLLLFTGCAYNITKEEYEENQKYYERVNKICEDKDELSIVALNNRSFKGKNLVMTSDTTSFINLELNSIEIINTNDIAQIEFKGTGASTFEGIIFGSLAGGLAANVLSNPSTGESGHWKIIPISVGVFVGGFIGIIYSIIYPGSTTISLNN